MKFENYTIIAILAIFLFLILLITDTCKCTESTNKSITEIQIEGFSEFALEPTPTAHYYRGHVTNETETTITMVVLEKEIKNEWLTQMNAEMTFNKDRILTRSTLKYTKSQETVNALNAFLNLLEEIFG